MTRQFSSTDPRDIPRPLRIAMIGTRGVPAAYGGFETAVEEIGSRLVQRGHDVTVYCRGERASIPPEYLGMKLVHRPALKYKTAETLSHTAFSVLHAVTHRRPDMAFVFNAANAPFLPMLRARGIPNAVHVDGLEWKRDKWGANGKRFYRWAEEQAVRWGDTLISDADGIADYYRSEFALVTDVISYGAPILKNAGTDKLTELGLAPGEYHLVVARFEPENHVDVIVEGYSRSSATLPLIVVGSAPYAAEHTAAIQAVAAADPRIRLLGAVYDQSALDQLYAGAASYLHGHSVGGTNPSLLRAMGAGTAVIAWDVIFNREVAGVDAEYFLTPDQLSVLLAEAELNLGRTAQRGEAMQARAEANYDWDIVASRYESLALRLAGGYSSAGRSHPRTKNSAWTTGTPSELSFERAPMGAPDILKSAGLR